MQIEPKDGPTLAQPAGSQASARDRAIAKMEAMLSVTANTNGTPVPDPSNISVEELGAITTPNRQVDTNETSTSDEPPTAETKAAEPEEPISSQYAVLARKEKALRAREQQFRQREEAIKAREAALNPQKPAFDESKYISKDKLASDPFSVLSELGLTYDDITNKALNAPTPEQRAQQEYVKKLESRLEALEQGQSKVQKTFEESAQESRKQAVTQIRNEAANLVYTDPAFETIKETNSLGDVVELIEKTFDTDGILLTVEEAAQQVEEYLVEEAMKIARIKKIQQRLMPKAADSIAPQASKPTDQPKQQQLKTLTNSVSASRQLTSRERAILAAEGKLNK